ncbi:MAG: LysR family transcriptional regulator [Cyanobacteria bacterium J069]|nr:MAG: LysR family transcriptional regulator [Cyanobacteria bacterium J069]
MKLSQLRILIAVAERGNFSEAALHLEMSQSAVSHAIAALENLLGVVLFVRGRHGARLTPVCEEVLGHAREIVNRADAIAQAAADARGLKRGQVRVAAFRSAATHLLPTVITRFHQQHPGITVNLSEHEDYPHVEQSLREGQADLGFTFMPVSEEFEVWRVFQDEFIALLPATFQPVGQHLTWAELVQHPLIMPPKGYIMMRPVYDHAKAQGYSLKADYEVETDATIVSLVAQGLGAAILPRLAAEPIPAGVKTYSLPIPLERRVGVVTIAQSLLSPAVYAFLDVLKTQ